MIRFRLGELREEGDAVVRGDSFGLEVDGIDLLPAVSGEPLTTVVPELLAAVSALYARGERLAQVSFPEAHLELVLSRREDSVEVAVVDLGRPARIARGPALVDLHELSSAALECARNLMQGLRQHPQVHLSTPMQRMMRQVSALERPPAKSAALLAEREAAPHLLWPSKPISFQVEIAGSAYLLDALARSGAGALSSLLFDGRVALALQPDTPVWRAAGKPFLLTLEISRQAADVSRARQLQELEMSFQLGGVGPRLTLDLAHGRMTGPSFDCELAPVELERAMFDLGLSLAYFAFARNANQRKNPYLATLVERCREGLAQLKAPAAPAGRHPSRSPARGVRRDEPVHQTGELRRLRFTELWKKTRLGGDEPGCLLLGANGPIFSSPVMACAFSPRGDLLFRRLGSHGVAVSRDYRILTASSRRLELFIRSEKSASWTRDHEGWRIGPSLIRSRSLLVGTSAARTVFGVSELTGREVWRLTPAGAREAFCAVRGERVLLAADSGDLYSLNLADGQTAFRLRTPQRFSAPPVAWGSRFLCSAAGRDYVSLTAADARRGTVHWSAQLDIRSKALPIVKGDRAFMVGERGSDGLLICLGSSGKIWWERRLHWGHGPFALAVARAKVIATSPRGGAVCFDTDGQVAWRLGELSSELLWPCQPALARGVIFVPGPAVRAVDVQSGEVLAELPAGIGLCDLRSDAKLNVYLLDDDGTLRAHRLASHLAVVGGPISPSLRRL